MKITNLLLAAACVLSPLAVNADPGPRMKLPRYVTANADGSFSVPGTVSTNRGSPVTLFLTVIPCSGTLFDGIYGFYEGTA